jgi:hypothetical protein
MDKTRKCTVCDTDRYKKGKKAPRKLVWYFSLVPHLQHYFMDRKEAKLMRRHAENKGAVLNGPKRFKKRLLPDPSDAS